MSGIILRHLVSLAAQQENIDRTDAMKASLLRRDILLLLAFMGQHTASQVRISQVTIIVNLSQLKTSPFRALSVSATEGPVAVMVGNAKAVGPIRLANPLHRGEEPFARRHRTEFDCCVCK